jgi:nicotinamidase-related amidase
VEIIPTGPEMDKSALIVVDMQNDFVHTDMARQRPGAAMDMPFLTSTIPQVKRLADGFRRSGRPVIYVAHVLAPGYSDAQFPWRRVGLTLGGNSTFIVEGSWGAQIVDDLKPRADAHVVVKKGIGGFSNAPLDTILRRVGVTTCVTTDVTTCVCISTTVRGGVAEVSREDHEAELMTMDRLFADVRTTDEVIAMLNDMVANAAASRSPSSIPSTLW